MVNNERWHMAKMKKLNELFQELGISKVRLAKYVGVFRQMVDNYLELDDISKWPKEKRSLLCKLLDIEDGGADAIDKIKVTTDYLMNVEAKLNQGVKNSLSNETYIDMKGLNKESQQLIADISYLIKEKLLGDKGKEDFYAIKYLYHMLQSLDNVPEIKYIFAYMSKTTGFTNPSEFKFQEERQFIFESILYSALTLYNNGGASRSRLQASHRRWVQEIEAKKEEKLSRTQQFYAIRTQALSELNYTEINPSNATEVIEKMAEIESRKI